MNIKNLAMWAVIVILTIGLYNMFENPQRAANQNNTIIFSEFLNEVEMPLPLSNNLSGDPQAESWLQLLMTLVVREHGHSSLPISSIEKAIGEKMNREGVELEIFLDRLWIMGRLERIYGGAEVQYSPNPSWLESQ